MSAPSMEFKYSEAALAKHVGVARQDVKFLRDTHLSVDRDFARVHGEIAFNVGGLKKVLRALGTRPTDVDLASCLVFPDKKNGAEGDPATGQGNGNGAVTGPILPGSSRFPIPEKMRVTRICPNPAVVLAEDRHGATQSVWVGRNDNFAVGMDVLTAPHLTQAGFWRLVGPMPQQKLSAQEWNRRQALAQKK